MPRESCSVTSKTPVWIPIDDMEAINTLTLIFFVDFVMNHSCPLFRATLLPYTLYELHLTTIDVCVINRRHYLFI